MRPQRVIIAICLCFSLLSHAQTTSNKGNELMKDAKTKYEQKEYIPARFLYKQAYDAYAASENYSKAVECGVKVSSLYYRDFLYKEAFDLCRVMDQMVSAAEQKQQKGLPDLHFLITKERVQMYLKLKNPAQTKAQLDRLESLAGQSDNPETKDDLLYTKMTYFYTFGLQAQGDASFSQLISQYRAQKKYEKVNQAYKKLISIALRSNNAPLVSRTYDKLIAWTDAAKTLTAQDELSVLKRKYNESQQTIQEKDDALSTKKHIIIGLITIIVILGIALAFLGILLVRYIATVAKQKKSIRIANDHNELKTQFISNISSQMAPTLGTLTQSAIQLPGAQGMVAQIEALRSFSNHIQELTSLENSLSETFELNDNCNVGNFCEELMNKIKPDIRPNVATFLDITNLQIKTNTEQLAHILTHLLRNAAHYTEEGKITLEFKKRGARMFQFVITDTGAGIPAEQRDNLFKPFSEIKDLTQGDGLGLPICALIAIKLNGSLALDTTYTKGSRFILKLNS